MLAWRRVKLVTDEDRNQKRIMSQVQNIIDEERGFLDRKKGQEPGWSGPITSAYMKGYGNSQEQQTRRELQTNIDAHVNHGWYT